MYNSLDLLSCTICTQPVVPGSFDKDSLVASEMGASEESKKRLHADFALELRKMFKKAFLAENCWFLTHSGPDS
jgi:hypothetical protein